jgi:hypothetical protein
MALDVMVLPLRRFLLGDFTTGIEQLMGGAEKVHRVDPHGFTWLRRRATGRIAEWRANRQVRQIVRSFEAANPGVDATWPDEGDILYSRQLHYDLHTALLAYFFWMERHDVFGPFRMPTDDERQDFYAVRRHDPPKYHLVKHGMWSGFLLPCGGDEVVTLETDQRVGSSIAAKKDLKLMAGTLDLATSPDAIEWDAPDASVQAGWHILNHVVTLSLQHHLPVVFWG